MSGKLKSRIVGESVRRFGSFIVHIFAWLPRGDDHVQRCQLPLSISVLLHLFGSSNLNTESLLISLDCVC